MRTRKLRIGVDLDGVAADFTEGWIRRYNQDFGTTIEWDQVVTWDALTRLTHFEDVDAFWHWLREDHSQFWHDLGLLDGAKDVMERWHKAGHKVAIIATKPRWSYPGTVAWLERHGLPFDDLHLLNFGSSKADVECDVYVDDADHNLQDYIKRRPGSLIIRYPAHYTEPMEGAHTASGRNDAERWSDVEALVARAERAIPVGITGPRRHGKSTVGEMLTRIMPGAETKLFAKHLKMMLQRLDPYLPIRAYTGNTTSCARYSDLVQSLGAVEAYEKIKNDFYAGPEMVRLAQKLGTEAGREVLGENVWVDASFREVDPLLSPIFVDARFPHEFASIRDRGGIIISVHNPNAHDDAAAKAGAGKHVSEHAWRGLDVDAHIENDGTLEDLYNDVLMMALQTELVEFEELGEPVEVVNRKGDL